MNISPLKTKPVSDPKRWEKIADDMFTFEKKNKYNFTFLIIRRTRNEIFQRSQSFKSLSYTPIMHYNKKMHPKSPLFRLKNNSVIGYELINYNIFLL